MPKYYAVRVGRTPGVYTNWTECQTQVTGYSGAMFKSFKSQRDAQAFLVNKSPTTTIPVVNKNTLEIFTDGSHIKNSSIMGYGILFRYLKKEYGLSRNPLSSGQLAEMFGGDFTKASNPTMEFAAIAHALKICNQSFSGVQKINLTYDYIGSKNWLLGIWCCRQPYIKSIYNFAKVELDKLTSRGVIINWIHVKSHTGHRENEIADLLAKGKWPEDLLGLDML